MTGIFNGELIDFSDLNLNFVERAFCYGDGLFETIIVQEGKIKFLDYHLERLHQGMKALSINGKNINKDIIESDILNLIKTKGDNDTFRIKLQVWRKSGGLYTPTINAANYLMSWSEYIPRDTVIKRSGISEKIRLNYSTFSSFKTCNSLPYILAGIEKKDRDLDEIILLDNQQNLSECSSSNLFWTINKVIFTPSLASGCIAGIMRRHILQQAAISKRKVFEVLEKPPVLAHAAQVFCCNVTGTYLFENINGKSYNTSLDSEIAAWINI